MGTNKRVGFDEPHSSNLKMVIALNRATNQLNRRAATIFRKHGLTFMQFAVLEALYHKGDLKIGEIVEKILATGGNMTVVIRNLAKSNLIEKRSTPEDRRAAIISLTAKGREIMDRTFPDYLEDLRAFMNHLGDSEKKSLVSMLKHLQQEG